MLLCFVLLNYTNFDWLTKSSYALEKRSTRASGKWDRSKRVRNLFISIFFRILPTNFSVETLSAVLFCVPNRILL